MPLPADINTVIVTGFYTDKDGNPLSGQASFTASQALVDGTGKVVMAPGPYPAQLFAGRFSITLPCTDNTTVSPLNFTWAVTPPVASGQAGFSFLLPHTQGPTVDITAIGPALSPGTLSNLYGLLAGSNIWTGSGNDFTAGSTLVATPTSASQAANKAYVDTVAGASGALLRVNNLSDLTSAGAARVSLGLGPVALLSIGQTAGTVAAGDDTRIVGAYPTSAVGAAGGAATLDNTSHLSSAQLPTNVLTTSNLPLAIASGGTGRSTASSALTALTGAQTAGFYVRSDGTNSLLAAPQAADLTGILSIANGGTGSSAQTFVTVNGDIGGTVNAPQVVSTHLAAPLPLAQGGTGQSTASSAFNALSPNTTLGDLTYASGASVNTRLPGNILNAKRFLIQTGTGVVSAAPSWGQLALSDLPVSNSPTSGYGLIAQTPTSALWVPPAGGYPTIDQGLLAQTFDIALVGSSGAVMNSGTLYLGRYRFNYPVPISELDCAVSTPGSGITNAYLGVYDNTGKLVVATANRSADAIWTAGSGPGSFPTSAAFTPNADWYWQALLLTFTGSSPQVGRQSVINATVVNWGLSAAAGNLRFATGGTGLTQLPASVNPTAMVADNHAWWFGAK